MKMNYRKKIEEYNIENYRHPKHIEIKKKKAACFKFRNFC